jgi:glycosyltransferase involved in cell wall biosynthesis
METFVAFATPAPSGTVPANLVTVAVNLRDAGPYLVECLASIAAQTHADLELVVVDDGSRDNSAALARDWLETNHARFAGVFLLRHAEPQGPHAARNAAFARARADCVFVLDASDMLYPRAIGRLLEPLRATGAGAAYSQLELFGDVRGLGDADTWERELFARGCYVDAMALVSKAAWQKVGGYDAIEAGWEAYGFWCKFVENGIEGLFVPEILGRKRRHPSLSAKGLHRPDQPALVQTLTARHPWIAL